MPLNEDGYEDILTEQNDILNNPEYIIDSDSSTITSFGWHDESGETIPFSVDTMGWYEDLRTQDSIIGFILSKISNTDIKVVMRRAIPHPSDMIKINTLIHNGINPGEYPIRYERYEIKTSHKIYTHIIHGSVDYSNDNILQFDIDDDLNDKIMNLGSTIRRIFISEDDRRISFYKRIILSYNSIVSIEPIIHVPIL